jgi:hypothetical protein
MFILYQYSPFTQVIKQLIRAIHDATNILITIESLFQHNSFRWLQSQFIQTRCNQRLYSNISYPLPAIQPLSSTILCPYHCLFFHAPRINRRCLYSVTRKLHKTQSYTETKRLQKQITTEYTTNRKQSNNLWHTIALKPFYLCANFQLLSNAEDE